VAIPKQFMIRDALKNMLNTIDASGFYSDVRLTSVTLQAARLELLTVDDSVVKMFMTGQIKVTKVR
jgi:hypothetical protein